MARKLFVNLPVKDLSKSVEFFTKLGFDFNPDFTDENATCIVLSEEAFGMLLVEDFFATFTNKKIADAVKNTEAILALSAESREEVDELADNALAAGAQPSNDPTDKGFMYTRSFQDLDGHLWEVVYMDMEAEGAPG